MPPVCSKSMLCNDCEVIQVTSRFGKVADFPVWVFLIFFTVALSACGGGGAGAISPPLPEPDTESPSTPPTSTQTPEPSSTPSTSTRASPPPPPEVDPVTPPPDPEPDPDPDPVTVTPPPDPEPDPDPDPVTVTPPPDPDPAPVSPTPLSVPTPKPSKKEVRRSNFLPLINAGARYAASSGGRDIVVAVIDSEIDFSHPDLDGVVLRATGAGSSDDHGTAMAGLIAARQNGKGIHGVAWNATLVNLGFCFFAERNCYQTAETRSAGVHNVLASHIASAAGLTRTYNGVTSNPAASSHIINMSFGLGLHNPQQVLGAMRDAAGAGRIMVAGLGTRYDTKVHLPAGSVASSGIAGLGIAVGALDEGGKRIESVSDRCGTGPMAQYCLFAPGEFVRTTQGQGGWSLVSGTSAATAIVSGAAAVVWGEFPNKTGRQIVARLLDTAGRKGVFKKSRIYGRGRLDIEAALNPVGLTQFRLESGGTTPAHTSVVSLPSGFQAPSGVVGISNVVAYDEQDFPFRYDLNAAFHDSPDATDGALEGFLASFDGTQSYIPVSESVALELTIDEGDLSASGFGISPDDTQNSGIQGFEAHFHPQSAVRLSLGQDINYFGAANRAVLDHARGAILSARSTVAPFTAFTGRETLAWNLAWQSDERTTLNLVGQAGEGRHGGGSRLASVGLMRRVAGDWTAGTSVGALQEESTLLGIRSGGGFAGLSNAGTHFVNVSLFGSMTPDVTLFGSLSHGRTGGARVDSGASLVSGWEDMNSGSFLLGGEWTDLGITGSDRLVLTVGSPLRASSAQLRLRAPVEEVADQELRYTTEAVNLAPSGREKRVQFVYETNWPGSDKGSSSFALGGYMRLEPEHDAKADTDYGLAFRYRMRF